MKTLINEKAVLSADGKSVTITADIVDVPFNSLMVRKVSHGHLNKDNPKHPRMVLTSNVAVHLKSRFGGVSFPNDFIANISAVIDPATSFAPVFKKTSVPGNVDTVSELPVTYQWQISDDAFPIGKFPPPVAVWTDIAGANISTLDENTIADGKWIRCVAKNATGETVSKPAKKIADKK